MSRPPKVKIFSTKNWQIERTIETASAGESVAFSPDSKSVAVGQINATVTLIDLTAAPILERSIGVYASEVPIGVRALAFSPNGKVLATGALSVVRLAAGTEHNSIKIWNLAEFTLVASYVCEHLSVGELSWSADGRYLAAAMSHKLGIVLPGKPEPCGTADFHRFVNSVSFSPDGKQLAVAAGSTARLFSIEQQ